MKKFLGRIWNAVLLVYTLPLFTIMIVSLIIKVNKNGIDVTDDVELRKFCHENSILFKFYEKVSYRDN